MSLEKRLRTPQADIVLWRLEESEAKLREMVPAALRESYEAQMGERGRCDRRCREFWAARAVLHNVLGQAVPIRYTPDGRPFLNNSQLYISISHSDTLLAVALSQVPVGIDVETISPRIEAIGGRFLTEEELTVVACRQDVSAAVRLTAAWCAKEAAFKCLAPVSPVKVISDIIITELSGNEALLQSTHGNGEKCKVTWYSYGSHVLATARMR